MATEWILPLPLHLSLNGMAFIDGMEWRAVQV